MKTIEAARGRWREILPQFDIPASALDGKHHPCPCTGDGDDRFRFSDREGSGAYFCQCSEGNKGGIALVMCRTGMTYAEVARKVDDIIGNRADRPARQRATYAEQLRAHTERTFRSAYLDSRGLELAPGLEWCREVGYRDADGKLSKWPAMLAPITRNGQFLTYHVTYLDGGKKAPVTPNRKILPGPELRGGACALYPAAETMGIAEGVETAIAAKLLHDVPVWAALNTALLKSFEPPEVCRHLLIFGDHDSNYAGQAAAYHLARRLVGKLDSVTVFLPYRPDADWNDVLLERAKEAA